MTLFKKIGLKILDFQARFILSLVFVFILPFFAILMKLISRKNENSNFKKWIYKSDNLTDVKNQY
jgi:uncharacterized membrane protein